MATAGEPNDENDDLGDMYRVVEGLRSAKKEISEIMKTFSDKLEKIERECINSRHRLRTDKHEQKQKITELENVAAVSGQSRSETEDSVAVVKLQEQLGHTTELLSRTKDELNATRQRLSDVQERLTVAEQVTAATQLRALQESDTSEQLQREVTQQHQPTTPTGFSWQIQDISDIKFVTFYNHFCCQK